MDDMFEWELDEAEKDSEKDKDNWEMSTDEDFFVLLHARHLEGWCPVVMRFLQLPPGWRFLTSGDYVDVWFDSNVDLSPIEER